MPDTRIFSSETLAKDVSASFVVFLVALPLCLGIALTSGAPLIAGIVAGVVGGIVVGSLSGSHVSVSAPAAGMTAVVAAQIVALGSFEAFLAALAIAGVIQIVLGLARVGFIAAFFPSSVVKGLLAAVGVILVLKQIPHLFGHDTDAEGEMSFYQPDQENTFSELVELLGDIHVGATVIGMLSIVLLIGWERIARLRNSFLPAPLVITLFGVACGWIFSRLGSPWTIQTSHLVQVPVSASFATLGQLFTLPDPTAWQRSEVLLAGLSLAALGTLETLFNLEAVDRIDPRQRSSPASRELLAQGIGNLLNGLIGGIPVASAITPSTVKIHAGGHTKLSTVAHGVLILASVLLLPQFLNQIPLASLAAILIVSGARLISLEGVRQMWRDGPYQILPFALTLVSIMLTDLARGTLIGLAASVAFILYGNLRRPLRRIVEKHVGGDVLLIELPNQVSFLNRASLDRAFNEIPRGGQALIDASQTNFIDPDVLALIRDFKHQGAPARGIQVSLRGFRDRYPLTDEIQYIDYSTREIQGRLSADDVLRMIIEGNARFREGRRLTRDYDRQILATAQGQHPLAVVVSCIDSRTPIELIFDLGLGDVFSIRIAGNVVSPKVLGSVEYSCAVAGAKLILVLGHTRCGAVTTAVKLVGASTDVAAATGCPHLASIIEDIQASLDARSFDQIAQTAEGSRDAFVDLAARSNVLQSVREIQQRSDTIRELVEAGRVAVVGAIYDVASGRIDILDDAPAASAAHNSSPRPT